MAHACITRHTYMLLNAQLLELDELGAARLQVETTTRAIDGALLAGAHQQRHERR